MLTNESKRLPESMISPTIVVCEESGRAAVVPGVVCDVDGIAVDAFLDYSVYLDPDTSEPILVQRRTDGDRQFGMSAYVSRRRLGKFKKLTAPTLAATFDLGVAMFINPRVCGCRCYWSCFDVYGVLKLDQAKGVRSKWVYDYADCWNGCLRRFGDGHHVQSTQAKCDLPFSRTYFLIIAHTIQYNDAHHSYHHDAHHS